MGKKHTKNEVLSRMADDFVSIFKNYVKNLYYDKTYTGIITGKSGNIYTVEIYGQEYRVKCNYNFPIGRTIDVLAKQNNMNNLSFVVSYDDLI